MSLRFKGSLLALALVLITLPALAQVNVSVEIDNTRLQGTAPNGELLLFTPDPVQIGSSISHWDPSAFPNLLMEPAINADLPFLGLDISPPLMYDLGWTAGTSTVEIISLDPPGVGFTDPRPFGGAPGNPATTLGEARVNTFNAVLGAWASNLQSAVDIQVLVTWVPLFCSPTQGAVLAGAGTTFIFNDNTGTFPVADTWYPAALAEAFAGMDLTGDPATGGGDIIVFMNSAIDEECLGAGTSYYYGTDGNNPGNQVDVAPVVLHEIGHGLGMSSFASLNNAGAFPQGLPGIYDTFIHDLETGKTWDQMTDAERVDSSTRPRRVTWAGAEANAAAAPILTPGVPELKVGGKTIEVATAGFGPSVADTPLAGELACLRDGVADINTFNGCTPAVNGAELNGKVALIDRGGCSFSDKVANAQAAGATGAIIVNNAGDTPPPLGGTDPSITIPAVGIGRTDGGELRSQVCPDSALLFEDNRFQVSAFWATDDASGEAVPGQLTDNTGTFYFFNPKNLEMLVKVLDGCRNNDHYWVFAAGVTNVNVNLVVLDTETGASQTYENPLRTDFQPILDTGAFATCP